MLINTLRTTITESDSIIAFVTKPDGGINAFDRYLSIDGVNAYHVGNVCDTCTFFFERLGGANQSIDVQYVVSELNEGLTSLDPAVVHSLQHLIPVGPYLVMLQKVSPKLVCPGDQGDYFANEQIELWGVDRFWGLPHTPKTEYYRIDTTEISNDTALFEFLIPMIPKGWLDEQRVSQYSDAIKNGTSPTAVSIGVLDVKQPAEWRGNPKITCHWCLAHYLIDGHHKCFAAAMNEKPLTLITFLAIDRGVSSKEQINQLQEHLAL